MRPLLQALHWLPVQARIDYNLSTFCQYFFSGSSPAYFSDLFTVYTPSRQLRSSTDTRILLIPHVRTRTSGQRCFSYCASKQWNSLPSHIRPIQSAQAFKPTLNTHLYRQYCNKWFFLTHYDYGGNKQTREIIIALEICHTNATIKTLSHLR